MALTNAAELNTLRAWLLILNGILCLGGGGMVAVGIWLITDKEAVLDLANIDLEGDYRDSEVPGFLKASVFMTAIMGGISVFESIYNCLSVCQLSKRSLVASCFSLALLLLAQLAVTLLLVVHIVTMNRHFKSSLYEALATDYEGFISSERHFSIAFDKAQVQFECCGIDNYTDFTKHATNWADRFSLQIPKACCKLDKDSYLDNSQYVYLNDVDCAWKPDNTKTNMAKACYESIHDWLEKASKMCLGIGSVLILFGVMTLVLTIILTRKVDRNKKENRQYKEDVAWNWRAGHKYLYF